MVTQKSLPLQTFRCSKFELNAFLRGLGMDTSVEKVGNTGGGRDLAFSNFPVSKRAHETGILSAEDAPMSDRNQLDVTQQPKKQQPAASIIRSGHNLHYLPSRNLKKVRSFARVAVLLIVRTMQEGVFEGESAFRH